MWHLEKEEATRPRRGGFPVGFFFLIDDTTAYEKKDYKGPYCRKEEEATRGYVNSRAN